MKVPSFTKQNKANRKMQGYFTVGCPDMPLVDAVNC